MIPKGPTLFQAVGDFMGPLSAEYCRLIDEGDPDTPVIIKIGGYEHETTLKALKDLDRAYHRAHELKCAQDAARHAKKAVGNLV